MQMVFYFNTNIWDNNPALTEKNRVVREEVTLATRSPGRARGVRRVMGQHVMGEPQRWWKSRRSIPHTSQWLPSAQGELLQEFHNLAFWIQMVCVNCQGHGGPEEGLYIQGIVIIKGFIFVWSLFFLTWKKPPKNNTKQTQDTTHIQKQTKSPQTSK